MPYIKEARRKSLQAWDIPHDAGELNYCITQLIIDYVNERCTDGLRYAVCNDVVGALENAKHEFQRRIQDPYEDTAIARNGDVYESLLSLIPDDS